MPTYDTSIEQFLGDLSSRAATPGGGSASALVGAIAAALCGMVGRLNDKADGTPGPLHGSISTADALMQDMKRLIDDDIRAFKQLSATWKLPADHPSAREAKQAAVLEATQSPIEIMSKAMFIMKLAAVGLEKSKRNCRSDAGVAAILSHAALEGARLNVLINLPGIEDARQREELRSRCESLHVSAAALRREMDAMLAEPPA